MSTTYIRVVIGGLLLFSTSSPCASNTATKSGPIEFRGVSLRTVASFLSMVANKPVLVSWEADCTVRAMIGTDVAYDEIVPRIEAAIESNGCQVVEFAHYIEIRPPHDDSATNEVPHVLITIHHGDAAIDGGVVPVNQIAETVKRLHKANEQIWIQELDTLSSGATPTNLNARQVVSQLRGIHSKSIFLAYTQSKANLKEAEEPPRVAQYIISVGADGLLSFAGHEVPLSELASQLKAAGAASNSPIDVQADAFTNYKRVVLVLAELSAAKFTNVNIETRK